jgi:hypothetical protein
VEWLLWQGPRGLSVWSVDGSGSACRYLYRIKRYGTTLAQCGSMQDVFTFLRNQHAIV